MKVNVTLNIDELSEDETFDEAIKNNIEFQISQMVNEICDNVYSDVKNKVYADVKSRMFGNKKIVNEISDQVRNDIKTYIYESVKSELSPDKQKLLNCLMK